MAIVWEYSGMENVDVGPPELFIEGENVGYLNGTCTLSYTAEKLQLKYGCPLTTRGTVITERTATLACEMLELSPDHYDMVAGDGVLTDSVTEVIHITDETHTFTTAGGDDEQITLAHNRGLNNIVVKSSDGVTTYIMGADYNVDFGQGVIFRNDSGDITSGASVKVSYDYEQQQPGNDIILKLGGDNPLKTLENVIIHKYNPRRAGKQHQIIQIWKMQSAGSIEIAYSADTGSFMTLPAEFEILADEANHADAPMFQITWADNFDINNYVQGPGPGPGPEGQPPMQDP